MPRLTASLPKYRKHKRSGQAVVTLNGNDVYLGPHGTKASQREYDRVIGKWVACGRRTADQINGTTIVELCNAYRRFAEGHYRKLGDHTSELDNIRHAIRPLRELYGHTPAASFSPLALKAIQIRMIEDGLSRGVINQRIGKIKRLFRWAVSEELAPPSLCHALSSVMVLQRGRTNAREAIPVRPVDDSTVNATLPFLSPTIADMVRFQRLTGARPAEVCILRPCDLDRTGTIWTYRPSTHKTETGNTPP